ncbi:biliverdin-producing heme oxygenase [bacterium]|nr:biliverdin-producing heme oxygenase [bacterium]
MIRERIKSETKEAHDAVESVSYSKEIMSGKLNEAQYKELIRVNYSLNKAFEQEWDKLNFEVPSTLMLDHRSKIELLEKDMELLGVDPMELEHVNFKTSTFPEFMGSLYVFEGSTLGGSVIKKQLEKNVELAHIKDFHFYKGYGDKTGMMWKLFLDELNKIEEKDQVDEAILAATTAFDQIHSAFKNGTLSSK